MIDVNLTHEEPSGIEIMREQPIDALAPTAAGCIVGIANLRAVVVDPHQVAAALPNECFAAVVGGVAKGVIGVVKLRL